MPVGRVKFYLPAKCFGFITREDGTDIFFGEGSLTNFFGDVVEGEPVEFDVVERKGKIIAVEIHSINDSHQAEQVRSMGRLQGRVRFWNGERMWGRIIYNTGTNFDKSIFFHISDVLLHEDGVQYQPIKDCWVEFEPGIRWGKEVAKSVQILEWPPETEQTAEEYFLSAQPEPEPEPEPIAKSISVLLKPENRRKTILELIQGK